MTVFDIVVATISPSVSSYIQCKGKVWRTAFIASLQTTAGVEYSVYKKKGLWQIKGPWENIKQAHKILIRLISSEDWTAHVQQVAKYEGTSMVPAVYPKKEINSGGEQGMTELMDVKLENIGESSANASEAAESGLHNAPIAHNEVGGGSQEDLKPEGEGSLSEAGISSDASYPSAPGNIGENAHGKETVFSNQVPSGSRRKAGRPRRVKIPLSYTEPSENDITPVVFPEETPADIAKLTSMCDADSEASDVPDDTEELSIEDMVKKSKAHIKRRKHSKGKFYSCEVCGFTCKSPSGLSEHRMRQHGDKSYKCPICDKAYGVQRDLRKHINRHTSQFKCEKCGKTYKEERNYKDHLKTHADNYIAPRFNCEQCPKSFTTKYVLMAHVDQVHNGNRTEWLCTTCGKKFRQKHSLAEHNLIHTGERPFVCRICHKTFRHKGTCVKHEQLHSDVRHYTCEICGKDFKHRNSLKIHAAIHDTERHFECNVCHKKFTQRQALIRHGRIHSGEKPFMCELCGDRFNDSSILRRHMLGIHKTTLNKGKQHFVLPADQYNEDGKVVENSEEKPKKAESPDLPIAPDYVPMDPMKYQPMIDINAPISTQNLSMGHIASSSDSPFIYPGFSHPAMYGNAMVPPGACAENMPPGSFDYQKMTN